MSINKQINKWAKNLNKQIKAQVSKKQMRKLAAFTLKLVRERTRQGYGVKESSDGDGGKRFKLPPLSDSYIEQRLRNAGKLSRFASISRANNTFTGRMLGDLKVSNVSNSSYSLGFRSRRSRQVAEYLVDMGREFMNLSRGEKQILVKFYRTKVLKLKL